MNGILSHLPTRTDVSALAASVAMRLGRTVQAISQMPLRQKVALGGICLLALSQKVVAVAFLVNGLCVRDDKTGPECGTLLDLADTYGNAIASTYDVRCTGNVRENSRLDRYFIYYNAASRDYSNMNCQEIMGEAFPTQQFDPFPTCR